MATRAGTLAQSILSLLWLRMWRERDYPQLVKQRKKISLREGEASSALTYRIPGWIIP